MKQTEIPENTYVRKYLLTVDEEEQMKKKVLVNGDFIRITNGGVYLTAYQGREKDWISFQSYGEDIDEDCSNIYTLFPFPDFRDL